MEGEGRPRLGEARRGSRDTRRKVEWSGVEWSGCPNTCGRLLLCYLRCYVVSPHYIHYIYIHVVDRQETGQICRAKANRTKSNRTEPNRTKTQGNGKVLRKEKRVVGSAKKKRAYTLCSSFLIAGNM